MTTRSPIAQTVAEFVRIQFGTLTSSATKASERDAMATVSYLKCPTEDGAERLLNRLLELKQQGLIQIEDAAIVTWSQGKKRPRTRQLTELSAAGALDGGFLGNAFWCNLLHAAGRRGHRSGGGRDTRHLRKLRHQ